MFAGKMNSHLIQTQENIIYYVYFPHKQEETFFLYTSCTIQQAAASPSLDSLLRSFIPNQK
jgi:hypothetical protein